MTWISLSVASVMYLNSMSVTWSARIQIFLTFSKLLAITIIIVPGLYQLFKGKTSNSHCQYYTGAPSASQVQGNVVFLCFSGWFSRVHTEQLQQLTQLPLSHINMHYKYDLEAFQATTHSCSQHEHFTMSSQQQPEFTGIWGRLQLQNDKCLSGVVITFHTW